MSASFLSEELHRIPVPLQNSWPFTDASWLILTPLFFLPNGDQFGVMDPSRQLDYCNKTLRFHMYQAKWHGRWRKSPSQDWKSKLESPPPGVAELSVLTSFSYITRTVYGSIVQYWDIVNVLLNLLFYLLFSMLAYTAITDDVPTFTGWRTIDISNNDVDKIQLSTRTVRAGLLFLSFANTSSASFFRLTVIYTRYVRGIIVFKRKHSEQIRYADLTDLVGQFDAFKFENWTRGVILNAMTVPYGSVWNLRHFTMT